MSFVRADKKNTQSEDQGPRLNCSYPGCNERWSVQIDKPMCSFHQWGERKHVYSNFDVHIKTDPADPLKWAKRIIAKRDAGMKVASLPLRMATEALQKKSYINPD